VKNRLITIGPSHYCDKARWALARAGIAYVEDAHAPIFHALFTIPRGGRTTPLLLTEDASYPDSTDILELADSRTNGALYGKSAAERREVKALEDLYDETLGPHTRRIAYFHLLDAAMFTDIFDFGLSRRERAAFRRLQSGIRGAIRRALRVDRKGRDLSRERVNEVFTGVAERLADGRRFLMGEHFGAADLTFAAMAAPVLLPPKYGYTMPSRTLLPRSFSDEVAELSNTVAGRFALRIYDEERGSSSSETL